MRTAVLDLKFRVKHRTTYLHRSPITLLTHDKKRTFLREYARSSCNDNAAVRFALDAQAYGRST